MTKKSQFIWWSYVIAGIVGILFLCPMLISEPDTLLVLAGVLLLVLYGVWTWHLWFKKSVTFIVIFIRSKINEDK